jgi:hypothetical protein
MHEELSEIFERFAREEFHNSSPLYEQLSMAIAKRETGCEKPFSSRQWTAAKSKLGIRSSLPAPRCKRKQLRFYKSLGGSFDGREDPYPEFQSFCSQHVERIRQLIAVRMVQTNEVSRCAGLMPTFATAAKKVPDQSLYLVDIGASAGLNLFWDHYGYKYGDLIESGDRESPVQINCVLKGTGVPSLPASFPRVAGRVGLDLHPLDVRVSEGALWLRALIWPEQGHRTDEGLAYLQNHGKWIEWLNEAHSG